MWAVSEGRVEKNGWNFGRALEISGAVSHTHGNGGIPYASVNNEYYASLDVTNRATQKVPTTQGYIVQQQRRVVQTRRSGNDYQSVLVTLGGETSTHPDTGCVYLKP